MKKIILIVAFALLIILLTGCSVLDGTAVDSEDKQVLNGLLGDRSETIDIVLMLTVLSILPSILIMMTCFPRIIIVLSLIRNGLGMQQMPPNQVLVGLALFLTFFVMSPVINEIETTAYEPFVNEEIDVDEALELAMEPVREFMMKQTYETDLEFFISIDQNK